jgi:hypothetical protein
MPGGDGTGPMGRGIMTGKGYGFCAGSNVSRCGAAWGLGMGFRRGFGRYMAVDPTFVPKTQKEVLAEQKELLENQLKFVNKRLEEE